MKNKIINIIAKNKKNNMFRRIFVQNRNGPQKVIDNLVEGLNKKRIKFSFNSKVYKKKINLVMDDVYLLEELIDKKSQGLLETLIAGPNISVLPSDHDNLLSDPNIDKILVPSKWVKDKYCLVNRKLQNKIHIWFSGTDLHKKRLKKKNRLFILLYLKTQNIDLVNKISDYLEKNNFKYKIIEYGKYNHCNYIKLLENASYCIFVSSTESQGLAILESWAMNVPTFILKDEKWTSNKLSFRSSSAPYLSNDTGLFFYNFNQLRKLIDSWPFIKNNFKPRQWVSNNMSNDKSIDHLLKILY